jgi:hypothetical protein
MNHFIDDLKSIRAPVQKTYLQLVHQKEVIQVSGKHDAQFEFAFLAIEQISSQHPLLPEAQPGLSLPRLFPHRLGIFQPGKKIEVVLTIACVQDGCFPVLQIREDIRDLERAPNTHVGTALRGYIVMFSPL